MANEITDKSLLQSVTRLLDNLSQESNNYDTLINILSLLCLVAILNRSQNIRAPMQSANSGSENPLQKILSEIAKSDGGSPSPDLLISLLPLLNSPQLKSKLNAANMSAVLGLINNLGGSSHNDKQHDNHTKQEKAVPDTSDIKNSSSKESAAATTSPDPSPPQPEVAKAVTNPDESERRISSRSLNWKSNF
ncbi:hypothetical protein P22_2292 [Propionispora sp. 2/2-37]|uniref:hypothetical protein n=1 Tax=Propionispora sp. 2/2-37 TaxID=1677858 RepID=UPI0006BB7C35|nr:hypothetical protein [Propionispora sp. 2/2-37]CUH96203.1 hypothetical protein P22_2292 [Propionispora sp. 2/2-37]